MSQKEEHIRDIPVNLLGQPREKFLQVLWNSSCLHSLLFSVDDESPSTLSNDATNSELRLKDLNLRVNIVLPGSIEHTNKLA